MINALYFGIGFLIYIAFNMITFKTYSKTPGMTKKLILFGIFGFYSLLAIYVISFVEGQVGGGPFEIIIQSLIFIIAGGLFFKIYYSDVIKGNEVNSNLSKLQDEDDDFKMP